MDFVVREIMVGDEDNWKDIDDSFTVDSTLVLSLTGRQIDFTEKEIPSYTKSYSQERFKEAEDRNYSDYFDSPDRAIYLACAGNQVVGRVIGGFDHYLYQGIHKNNDEIAIFWYLTFE